MSEKFHLPLGGTRRVGGLLGVAGGCQGTFGPSGRNRGLPLRRRGGQGPHLAKRWEPRGFSRVAAAFSSYNGDLSLPLGLDLGSPIFPSGCEGKLGGVTQAHPHPTDARSFGVRVSLGGRQYGEGSWPTARWEGVSPKRGRRAAQLEPEPGPRAQASRQPTQSSVRWAW